jgi:uncharacterized membrane protein
MKVYLFLLLYLSFLLAGQVLWKQGLAGFPDPFHEPWRALRTVGTSTHIVSGILLYGMATLIWLYLLSRFELSYIYPITSLSFVLAAILAHFWLGEDLGWNRVLGVTTICLGVYLVTIK